MKYLPQFAVFLLASANGYAAALLQPGDFIIAVNQNVSPSASSSPAGEPVSAAIDGTSAKYLNGGNAGSGFIVTPAAPSVMQSFVIQTANDASFRDPAAYQIYGTNEAIVSAAHSSGTSENWTLISAGSLSLPNAFNTNSAPVSFTNSVSYSSYKIVFTETKYITGQQAMQIGEFTAYTGANGTGSSIFAPGNPIIAIDAPVSTSFHNRLDNFFGNDQGASRLIDGNLTTKYLNYGKENSGFIVTPAVGSSMVKAFTITTGGDLPGRDPVMYTLYGTSVPITTQDNGFGTEDAWTQITTGTLALSDERGATSDLIPVENDNSYTSYKMVFNTIKDGASNSVQVAEIQFYDVIPEPSVLGLAGLGVLGLFRRRRP
jgi:hypothetical protein